MRFFPSSAITLCQCPRNTIGSTLAGLLICAAMAAPSQAADQHYEGVAYAAKGGQMVYREEHWLYQDNGVPARLVLYRCPSGNTPFARKLVKEAGGDAATPDFDFVDNRDGYREGVRGKAGSREVYVQKNSQAKIESAPLAARADGNPVIDAGFDAFVRGHWDQLGDRQAMPVLFLIPGRRDYLSLKLAGGPDTTADGQPARHLHMRLDAWYGGLAPSLDLFYANADHRLLRFQGISNIHDDAGKNQDVRIEFPSSRQFAAPAQKDIDAALAIPLGGKCTE